MIFVSYSARSLGQSQVVLVYYINDAECINTNLLIDAITELSWKRGLISSIILS